VFGDREGGLSVPTVLLLTYHFPPSAAVGGFRLLGFAGHLPKFGWRTAVVAPPDLPWEPTDPALAKRIPPDTLLYPVPYPRRAPKIIRWAAPYAIWLRYARPVAFRAVDDLKPDIILTSGPPHWIHLLGRSLNKKFNIPWLADFRDPWISDDPTPPLNLRRRWELFWERRVFGQATLVIANTPRAQEVYQAAHPHARDRIVCVSNGYDPELLTAATERRTAGPLRIVHAGQLYEPRSRTASRRHS
jgi:glycosyltransferase involved in cell wall biosynthesis